MAEKPGTTSQSGDHVTQAKINTIALGTDEVQIVWANNTGASVRISQVGYTPDTAVTGAASDNFILTLTNRGPAGAGTTAIAPAKTYIGSVDITQFDQDIITLSTTATDTDVANGEVVTLDKTETGAGLALPAGLVTLTYKFRG